MPTQNKSAFAIARAGLLCAVAAPFLLAAAPEDTPRAAADALSKTERALGAASAAGDGMAALLGLLDERIVAPMPGLEMPTTGAALVAGMQKEDGGARPADWTPLRVGVSADGLHGFTLGHIGVHAADGTIRPAKYLAYWIRRESGWRIAAFKRVPGAGRPRAATLAPLLPQPVSARETDPALHAGDAASLDAAERAFAAEAQRIGLGPAFAKYGRDDAINMGEGADFTLGAASIARGMGDAPTSPVHWAPDGVLVAGSGDLGLSWGRIWSNDPARKRSVPFFTIWRRDGRDAPWRYIAE
ncbi:nuclear transport factor 2 family protein [Sphingosinicella sp. BN140058]|uniref:nuclear transport factor 2 family protein n=1 Tax=Sphingosinicella sp. BN140058 TaxID=1892855 RepID=UPI001012EC73|nr:nuclear transport factor 2 family protein [Sphingosinicella sp. BN140058]QAY75839.1 nuclear transport factor 2 family protein [Sphingosinicella sp. BN140058]